jgi:hypothetical protein
MGGKGGPLSRKTMGDKGRPLSRKTMIGKGGPLFRKTMGAMAGHCFAIQWGAMAGHCLAKQWGTKVGHCLRDRPAIVFRIEYKILKTVSKTMSSLFLKTIKPLPHSSFLIAHKRYDMTV